MISKLLSSRIQWIVCLTLVVALMAGASVAYTQYRNNSDENDRFENRIGAVAQFSYEQRIESIRIWSEIMMFHLEFDAAQRSGFRAAFDEMDPDGFNNRFAIWELIGEMASEEQAERMRTIRNLRVRRSDVIRANRLGTQDYLESGGD